MRTMLMLAIFAAPLASPAIAQDSASPTSRAPASTKAKEQKYCFKLDDQTGSRIKGPLVCKTKTEWAREGVDVDNPQ